MLVDDHKITQLFAEAGKADNHEEDPFEVSDVETMLNHLKNNQ